MAFAALSNSRTRRVLRSQTSGKDRSETRIAGGVLLRGFLCVLAEGRQPWHAQHRRLGIIRWRGWAAGHEYILHGAAKRSGPVSVNRTGRRGGGLLASNPEMVSWPVWVHAAVTHHPSTTPQLSWCLLSLRRHQPLWMYFLMTTQPCLKSGQGSDCSRVQLLVLGSKVSMLPRAGPSLLTMPPVA